MGPQNRTRAEGGSEGRRPLSEQKEVSETSLEGEEGQRHRGRPMSPETPGLTYPC